MEFLIIGIATALNFIIIKAKIDKKRYEDAAFDASMLALLAFLFSGSYGGLVVAMVSSLAISGYLYLSPPKLIGTLLVKAKSKLEELKDHKRTRL